MVEGGVKKIKARVLEVVVVVVGGGEVEAGESE